MIMISEINDGVIEFLRMYEIKYKINCRNRSEVRSLFKIITYK